MMDVEITSFGYLHGEAPAAHVVLDLRHHFRDPHVRPELRELTALDASVRVAVRQTPGIMRLIVQTAHVVDAFRQGPTDGPIRVAVGCAGGRHRAAVVAMSIGELLDLPSERIIHRDLDKPVVDRDSKGNRS